MIKGCQKRIIHLKNTNSPYFEEAYFILRDSRDTSVKECDMVKEAEKIALCSKLCETKKRDFDKIKRFATVLLCASAVSLVISAIMLFIGLCR